MTLPEEHYNATNFLTLWDFEGVFKYSPLFYGWYTNSDSKQRGYRLPFAYFVTGLVVYAYSFFATLRKMAENSRMSKLSEKDDESIFSWKLFTAWDYMIGNAETAHNRVASIVMGFKEALLEEAEKKKQKRNWKVICFRVLVNTVVLGLLFFSAFAVIMVVKRSTEPEANSTVWRKNEITIVMSLITLFFPMLFEVLGFLEQYHPRKQLRLQLARIMVLNLLNLYSLIFALFDKILDMTTELKEYKNLTKLLYEQESQSNVSQNVALQTITCCVYTMGEIRSENLIADLAYQISTTTFPKIAQMFNDVYVSETSFLSYNNDTFTTDFYSSTEAYENFSMNYNISDFSSNNLTDSFDNFTDSLMDYLTYILTPFLSDVNGLFNNTFFNDTYNVSKINDTDILSDFNMFKTTILPINNTSDYFDERFDTELTTIFNEVISTIETFKDNVTKYAVSDTFNSSTSTSITILTTTTQIPETSMNYTARARLRLLCWETMFGQELLKLTVMDLLLTVLSTLSMDFFRGIFVRVMNRCWCWDLEKKFPQYGDFKVAENILHLVNNQGMVWMGMFFSPGLVVLNIIKLYLMMYFRAWAVLTCNVPHEVIFRASRSNNFYYALLLMMLFLCVLPVGYAIVWIEPSWHCGPFSAYYRIFHIFTNTIKNKMPPPVQAALDYIASPGIVIPLLVLLILVIYYLISLTGALREANIDLKVQLKRERTEERRKMFQMADRRRRGGSSGSNELSNTPFNKWKKLLGTMPSGKSFDETPKQESEDNQIIKEERNENKNKDFFAKFIKRALGKSSTSDEDQNIEDETDTEPHESLPDDCNKEIKKNKSPLSSGSAEFSMLVHKALSFKKSDSFQSPSDTNGDKQVKIQETRASTVLKRKEVDAKKIPFRHIIEEKTVTTRQDSNSSIWSDNIPVIKISKTESSENILDETITTAKSNGSKEGPLKKNKAPIVGAKPENETKFKPKIKCALTKQSTEIDEDVICHFGKDLEKKIIQEGIIQAVAREELKSSAELPSTSKDEVMKEITDFNITEDLTSESTEFKENSDDTVLNSTYVLKNEDNISEVTETKSIDGNSFTELSSEYNDNNLTK
ncbi:unnamed protein product [Brassicogethes aeneus]|uniref:TMC domain-containing protein n=1 Tax=Brassicogethes aeneus TaxID=1431903 RepID=A0A9P0ARU1_BRAAE|nr:unnamed protein product [Brassicogethes aeneus]